LLAGTFLAAPAQAASPIEIVVSDVGHTDAGGMVLVELRILNDDRQPQTVTLPDQVTGFLVIDGKQQMISVERVAEEPKDRIVAPESFARARYRFAPPPGTRMDGAILSIPAWSPQRLAIDARPASPTAALAVQVPERAQGEEVAAPAIEARPDDRIAGNAFLPNLSAYEPVYAVYGPGTNSDARIQISFKYQLFGSRGNGPNESWLEGLHFAYTQRMFWDLGAKSSPFRNIDYQPELIYLTRSKVISHNISVSGQVGLRHESNGRDGLASRSVNSIYVSPMAAMPLGDGYRLTVAPRLSFYVGDLSDNPDIRRYRGNTGLFLAIGKDDGLRLSTTSRFNFSSGKGALDAELSYPLPRLLGGGPDFYLFGQTFVGYGENLLDYNRHTTRFRIGLGLVR